MTTVHKRAVLLSLLGIVAAVIVFWYTRPDPGVEQMVRSRAAVRRATSWHMQTRTRWWEEDESVNCLDGMPDSRHQCGQGPITRWGEEMFRARERMLYDHAQFRKAETRVVSSNSEQCRDWLEVTTTTSTPKSPQVVRISCINEKDDLPLQIVIHPGRQDSITLDFSGWNNTNMSSYEFRQLRP